MAAPIYNGAVQGTFSVGPSGSANYSIPIEVPPGINGIQPNLAISYSSQSGNGDLGVGWGLSGISRISRCAKTVDQDGVVARINLDNRDRFCLDGQRLVLVNSARYGFVGAEYRTETDSYARIYSNGNCDNSPCSFTVKSKDGKTFQFASPRFVTVTQPRFNPVIPLSWALSEVSDTAGNKMNISYRGNAAEGSQIVDRIDYGYVDATRSIASIEFIYSGDVGSQLTSRADKIVTYQAGGMVSNSQLLTDIKTYANNIGTPVNVRRYVLTYVLDPITKRSILSKVDSCNSVNLCMEPLVIQWQVDNSAFAAFSVAPATNYDQLKGDFTNIIPGDFDGDGRTDFIRQEKGNWATGDSALTAQVFLSNGDSTFQVQLLTNYDWFKGDFSNIIPGDYDGDGKTDFIRQEKGPWDDDSILTAEIYLSNGDGTFRNRLLTNYDSLKGDYSNIIPGDYDGDGKTDFIRQEKGYWDDDSILTAEIYLSNGDGTFRNLLLTNYDQLKGDYSNIIPGDYDGDGKTDFIRQEKGYWDDDSILTAEIYLSNGDGTFSNRLLTNYDSLKGDYTNIIPGDYNGDGSTDFIRQEKGYWATGDSALTAQVFLSNGDGTFRVQLLTNYDTFKGDYSNIIPGDYNGDGKTDFIRQEKGYWDDDNILTANSYLANGDGTFTVTPLPDQDSLKGDFTNIIVGDYNGDGSTDFIRQEKSTWANDPIRTVDLFISTRQVRKIESFLNLGNPLGSTVTVGYKSLTTDGVHKRSTSSIYPFRDIQPPMDVVSTVSYTNGTGGVNTSSYNYEGAKLHLLGRGHLGFAKQNVTEVVNGTDVTVSTEFSQEYPYIGEVTKVETILNAGPLGKVISRTVNSYSVIQTYNAVIGVYRPYLRTMKNELFDVVDTSNIPYKTITKEVVGITENGEVTNVLERTEGSNGSEVLEVTTVNQYWPPTYFVDWKVGLVKRTTVSANNYQDPIESKVSEFDYYFASEGNSAGLLKWEKNEPDVYGNDTESVYLQTDFKYDGWGMIRELTTSGDPTAPRPIQPSMVSTIRSFAANGEPQEIITNQYGESTLRKYDSRWGAVINEVDNDNGESTTSSYNDFGMLTSQIHQINSVDSVTTTWTDFLCAISTVGLKCKSNELYYRYKTTSGVTGAEYSIYDFKGRLVRSISYGNLGQPIESLIEYNNRGEIYRESNSQFYNSVASYWTTYSYDVLGRLKSTTMPDGTIVEVTYNGLATSTTKDRFGPNHINDVIGLVSSEKINPAGKIVMTTDHDDHTIVYDYGPFGNLKEIRKTSPSLPTDYIIENKYDRGGRVISVNDPDRGFWQYQYDALGNLRKQIDAKNQVVSMEYDLLNRMVSYTDHTTGEISTWTYYKITDPVGGRKVGALKQVNRSSDGYQEEYRYYKDSSIRKDDVSVSMGGYIYTLSTGYDSLGRVKMVSFPYYETIDATGKLIVKNESYYNQYNAYGFLYKVTQGEASNSGMYWSALYSNSNNQITGEIYGNSLVSNRSYDPKTGKLSYIKTGPNNSVQNLEYEFDNLGNVESKSDLNRVILGNTGVKQTYLYDRMNRLTTVMQAYGGSNYRSFEYRYNDLGNLTYKSDIGYLYYTRENNAGPHAVSKTSYLTISPPSPLFNYDKNGNMLAGRGRTIAYSTFNNPTNIKQSGAEISFSYAPDQSRYKKTVTTSAGTTTSYNIGGLFEVNQIPGGGIEYIHNIYVGDRLVSVLKAQKTSTAVKKYFIHVDHLGSVDVITNEMPVSSNFIKERFQYDPYGKNIDATWNDGFLASFTSGVTKYGHTGHEMLPEVGLIHMNGRVYDPTLGRFLSADPTIPMPTNSQSYNRYSFLFNNPLSFTDGDGYGGDTTVKTEYYSYRVPIITTTPIVSMQCNSTGCWTYTYYEYRTTYIEINGSRTSSRSLGNSGDATSYSLRQRQQQQESAAKARAEEQASVRREAEQRAELQRAAQEAQQYKEREAASNRQQQLRDAEIQKNFEMIRRASMVAFALVGPDPQTVISGYNAFQKGDYSSALVFIGMAGFEISPWGKITKLFKFVRGVKGGAKEVGILRDAAMGKGNFGLGSGTRAEADRLGKAWVGDSYEVASDAKTLVSADRMRQYRPPSYKPKLGKTQANFERRFPDQQSTKWQSNGHLDITE